MTFYHFVQAQQPLPAPQNQWGIPGPPNPTQPPNQMNPQFQHPQGNVPNQAQPGLPPLSGPPNLGELLTENGTRKGCMQMKNLSATYLMYELHTNSVRSRYLNLWENFFLPIQKAQACAIISIFYYTHKVCAHFLAKSQREIHFGWEQNRIFSTRLCL